MTNSNSTPLFLAGLLIVLICFFSILRLNDQILWKNSILNFDIALAGIYIIWILFESKVSKREAVMDDKNADFGTCELYAIGQGAVIASALWFTPVWKTPNTFHILGFLMFMCGLIFRGWAIITLGRYYSHKVRKIEKHTIITTGPYHYIRHPAYTGMLFANAGIVLFFLNVATVFIFLLLLTPAIIVRIVFEEKTLYKIEGYPEFAESRKRLIPLLW